MLKFYFALLSLLFTQCVLAAAGAPLSTEGSPAGNPSIPKTAVAAAATDDSATAPNYILGAGDQVSVLEPDMDELAGKAYRIDMAGDLNLPLVGRVHAAGLTLDSLRTELEKLVAPYVKRPNVVVGIVEYRSQPVSVIGEVGSPGVHQLEGQKTLYEVLSLAGGVRSDAGNTVVITRKMKWGKVPLPNAKVDPSGQFSVASVSVTSVLTASDPTQNITICPNDVISVSRAEVVYAVGSVNKPGGFTIGQSDSLSALQVLSLAQGLQRTAASDKAKILRAVPNSSERVQIAVNLKQLMAGKGSDVRLQPDDILFVPNSGAKSASAKSLDAIVTIATGLAIYGRY